MCYACTYGGDDWLQVVRLLIMERQFNLNRYLPPGNRATALTTACR